MSGWGYTDPIPKKFILIPSPPSVFPIKVTQFLSVPFPQPLKGSYSTRRIWACTQALVTGSSDHYLHTIFTLIKTITKFSNVIGCHQPDLSTNRTVDTSCLCKWTVSDVVAHFAESIVVFFNENVQLMSTFPIKFCHRSDQLKTGIQVVEFYLLSYS